MAMNTRLIERDAIEVSNVPIDCNGVGVTGDWYNLALYNHITFIICQGAWAGGTPAVTLAQALDVAGTSSKALAFTKKWSKVAITGTVFESLGTAVVSSTFNLPATANTITVVEVDAASLDVQNKFKTVQLNVATPGSNSDLICVVAILSGARNMQDQMADSKV